MVAFYLKKSKTEYGLKMDTIQFHFYEVFYHPQIGGFNF